MKREKISISDSGVVSVPTESTAPILMTDFEIAQLLGVMLPTVRGCIKRLLKSRMILDCSGGEVSGNRIIQTHFGLDVIIAIAFQVESYQADIFRKYIMNRMTQPTAPTILMRIDEQNRSIKPN
ncbi:MAG: hypothetical protein R3Y66_07775 [Rikenellaceae bacterium]